jgi:uncharacterized protein involved in exopolysaccharide biosynthesis
MDGRKDITDIKGIMRRRKKVLILTFLLILAMGLFITIALPSIYLSRSTILIEDQQIPREYVQTTITGYVEERLQMITQQIMSRLRLLEIINQFNLYPEMQQGYTTEEIIEKMRGDINLETISAEVIDRRTGRPTVATIAFSLSYEGKDPSTVQKVANVLASLYLEENLRSREKRASTTTAFLRQESDELKQQLNNIQNKISEFKKAHSGELPEYNTINMQAIVRLDRDLDHINVQLNALRERKILLEGQLASLDPLAPVITEEGKTVMNPSERLKFLRLQLITFLSRLSAKHPDVKKLKKEILELEKQVGKSDASIQMIRRLDDLNGQLADMKGKLGPRHPDVMKLTREVKALTWEIKNSKSENLLQKISEQRPDNPAYINSQTQIASTEIEINHLLEERQRIKKELGERKKRIENAPLVEKEYNNLMRDYENAKYKYNEIINKLMEAKVAQGMEETQRGERFTIIDPAQLPERPHKPNRTAIILVSFILAIGASVGLAAACESMDQSIKTREELASLTGVPVLSVIPQIQSDEQQRSRQRKRIMWLLATVCAVLLSLLIIDHFIMPLDVLWIKIQRRIIKVSVL